MSYKCKNCGQDVYVDYRHFKGGGALLMIHVQTLDGNYQYVEQCPTCGSRLLIYDDLEFIHDDEYHREDERPAAL